MSQLDSKGKGIALMKRLSATLFIVKSFRNLKRSLKGTIKDWIDMLSTISLKLFLLISLKAKCHVIEKKLV